MLRHTPTPGPSWITATLAVAMLLLGIGPAQAQDQEQIQRVFIGRGMNPINTEIVVRYASESTERQRRDLEAASRLTRIFDDQDGRLVAYSTARSLDARDISTILLRHDIVEGVLPAVDDASGVRFYCAPNQLLVHFSSLQEHEQRLLLQGFGAKSIESANVRGLYSVLLPDPSHWYAAFESLSNNANVAQVEPVVASLASPTTTSSILSIDAPFELPLPTAWDLQTQENLGIDNVAWQLFGERYPGDWNASWDVRTRNPSLLYGPGISLSASPLNKGSGETVRLLALEFLRDNEDLFRIGRFDLAGKPVLAGNTWIVNFNMSYQGIPLEDHSRVTLGIKTMGGIAAIELESVPSNIEALVATVPAMRAVAEGARALGARNSILHVTEPTLVILDDEQGVGRLAWRFTIRRHEIEQQHPLAVEFFVGARDDARVLYAKSLIDEQQQAGSTSANKTTTACGFQQYCGFVGGSVAMHGSFDFPDSVEFPDLAVMATDYGKGHGFTSENGDICLLMQSSDEGQCRIQLRTGLQGRWCSVRTATTTTCQTGENLVHSFLAYPMTSFFVDFQTQTDHELAQTTAYYWTTIAHDWSSERMYALGYDPDGNGFNDGDNGVKRQLPVNVNRCTGLCGGFYDGTSINFAGDGYDDQGHYQPNMAISDVIAHEYGHAIDRGLGNALDGPYGEGFSDAFAMALTGQSIVGRGGCPGRDGNHVVLWTDVAGTCWDTSIHCIGWSYMGFTWKLRSLLQASLGNLIGQQTVEQLILGPAIKNPSSIPNAVFWTFVCDDLDSNLNNGTPDYCDILAAAMSRALPVPSTLLPVVNFKCDDSSAPGKDSAMCEHDGDTNADFVPPPIACGSGALSFAVDPGPSYDHSTVQDSDSLDLLSAMTGMAWVWPGGNHDTDPSNCVEGTIFTKGGNYWFQLNNDNSGILFQNDGSGAPGTFARIAVTIPTDKWTHVAFVRTSPTNVRLFVNGVLNENYIEGTGDMTAPSANSAPLTIGTSTSTGENCEFNGLIDEVRIYPRAFSDAEILQFYNAQAPCFE